MPSTLRNRRPHPATLRLREAIREAIYRADDAGDPCPTLIELSAALQVSRDVLRYNLNAMVTEGILEIRETRRREYCRPAREDTQIAVAPAPAEKPESGISLDELL